MRCVIGLLFQKEATAIGGVPSEGGKKMPEPHIFILPILFFQIKANGIDTVSFSGWRWPVIKYMSQMRAAFCARDFCPSVGFLIVFYRTLDGFIKTWPAGARVKLGIWIK